MQDSPPDVKRVLFCDDDTSFLALIEKVFRLWSKGALEIIKVGRIDEVVPTLEHQRVHLLVIDTYTPGKDGVKFLRSLHKQFPAIPKAVLTENYSSAVRDECTDNGALRCLEKPRTMEAMERIYKLFEEMANAPVEGGFIGTVRVPSLVEILQLECLNRNSSVMEFVSGRFGGKVFIENGSIIHADAPPFTGTDALNYLLALKGGDFKLVPFVAPPEKTISDTWESLLMQAAQSHDEGSSTFFRAMAAAHAAVTPKEKSGEFKIPPHLEEVVYAKTQPLDEIFGPFNRLQILSEETKILADLDVSNVARRESARRASAKTEKSLKQKLNHWLVQIEDHLPSALALGIIHTDYSSLILTQYLTRQSLDKVCLALKETTEELQFGGVPVDYLQWRFENATVYGSERKDGELMLVISPREIPQTEDRRIFEALGSFLKM